MSNFGQAAKATILYAGDYDERLMPSNHQPGQAPDAVQDRVWPQILMPYLKGFRVFDCPSEPNSMEFGGSFDPDLLPGDYTQRYYDAALHSDLGYNGYYLAPVVRNGEGWEAHPRALSELGNASRTMLFIESRAQGGGSYLVAPPCRYIADHNQWTDTFLGNGPQDTVDPSLVYAPIVGWDVSGQQSAFPTGGVAVRHGNRLNVARLDGSTKPVTLGSLTQGCQVRSGWRGSIIDPQDYLWYPTD